MRAPKTTFERRPYAKTPHGGEGGVGVGLDIQEPGIEALRCFGFRV